MLHDDAGAKKADAGDHVGDNLGRAGIAIEMHADVDEGCRAYGHQHMRAQTAAALAVLALSPNQPPKHEGRDQTVTSVSKKSGRVKE